jgi:predicted sulfurtransferase
MESQEFKNQIELARQLCLKTKLSIDVYLTDKGIKHTLTSSRNSKKYLYKLTYENEQVIIKDAAGNIYGIEKQSKGKKLTAKKQEEIQDNTEL